MQPHREWPLRLTLCARFRLPLPVLHLPRMEMVPMPDNRRLLGLSCALLAPNACLQLSCPVVCCHRCMPLDGCRGHERMTSGRERLRRRSASAVSAARPQPAAFLCRRLPEARGRLELFSNWPELARVDPKWRSLSRRSHEISESFDYGSGETRVLWEFCPCVTQCLMMESTALRRAQGRRSTMTEAFVDTFYWVAILNPKDSWHEQALTAPVLDRRR